MGTVPTPPTFTAGSNATSTIMQAVSDSAAYTLGSTTSGGSRKPLARLTQTVPQSSIASGTAVTFDAESSDYDSSHSTITNTSRFTAQTAGDHTVQVSTSVAANTTGTFRTLVLRTNGTTAIAEDNDVNSSFPSVVVSLSLSTSIYLNVGDYIEAIINHNATALNTAVTNGNSRMAVTWVSN